MVTERRICRILWNERAITLTQLGPSNGCHVTYSTDSTCSGATLDIAPDRRIYTQIEICFPALYVE